MGIRVLRVLEYEYEDAEVAAQDMDRWTTNISYNHMRMRSTTLPFDAIEWHEGPGAYDDAGDIETVEG